MKILDCEQGTYEWHEARRGIPTASEFSRIITPAKWQYAAGAATYICELIAERYNPNYGFYDEFASLAMANGTLREPEARRYFEFTTGLEVKQVGFCLSDCGRYGASPDALVGDDGGLEIKAPDLKTHVKWCLEGELPKEHAAQVHGCMHVTGRSHWWWMSYCPPLPELLIRVERDEKTEQLAETVEKFCGEYAEAVARLGWAPPAGPAAVELDINQEIYF